MSIYIGFHVIKFHCFLPAPPPPPPPHFCCFPYTTTTTANTFLLFSFHHHHHYRQHHISIFFPPPAPHFYFSHHHHHRHRISIVFPPPSPPPPLHFHCFLPQPSPPPHFYCFPSTTTITSFPFFPSTRFYERLPTTILSSLVHSMSRVVNNNHGFLHFLDRSVTWSAVPRARTSRARAESIARTLKASLLYSS